MAELLVESQGFCSTQLFTGICRLKAVLTGGRLCFLCVKDTARLNVRFLTRMFLLLVSV